MNFVFKNKMCKAFSVFLLIALAFTLVLPVGAETYPTEAYDTYTYWAGPDETYPVSTTPIYEYKDVITGDSLGVGAFNEPQDVYTDKNGNIYIIYDRERDNRIKLNKETWMSEAAKEIIVCKITIEDIINKKLSEHSYIRKVISKAKKDIVEI